MTRVPADQRRPGAAVPPQTSIRLCGRLRVELRKRRVEDLLPARQGRLLFVYLVVRRHAPVGRDELVEALWPQRAPADPHAALHTLVARLRAALGGDTVVGRGELSLMLGPDPWIDVEVAEAAVAAGRMHLEAGRPEDARSRAEEALAIIEQPLLHDLDRVWLDDHRRRLQALRPPLLAVVGHAGLALGGGAALERGTEAARELAELEPFRESARVLLMRLHAAAGDVAEALRTYDDLRLRLRDELGTAPSPQLAALHRRLLTAPEEVAPVAARAPSLRLPARRDPGRPPAPPALPRPLQSAIGPLPLAGRRRQIDDLTASWGDVDAGARRVVVISGEAGIGKTRMAAELAARVHGDGSLVLYGRCDEDLAVPYQPFVEALRGLLPTLDAEDVRDRLGALAPELGRLLPELAGFGAPPPADAESARFALFEAVVALLELTTARRRTLLVIDDVHWAQPTTLLLLRHIVRSARPLALLVVVTFRSTELGPDEPLAQLLADLQRDDSVRRVALTGLDDRAIDLLLEAAVGPALTERAPQLVAHVHAEIGGNPFFLREIVAHLLESGALAGAGDGAPAALPPAALDIPEGLRGVIRTRVARLSEPAQRLLEIASVAGAAIDVAVLDSLIPDHGGLLDALDETVAAGLLVDGARNTLDFAHALVRHAIYDGLGTARRLHLHRRLGEALERRDDSDEHVEALAHHFAQLAPQGETERAIAYAIAAGRAATERLAYEDAAAHFRRGLDVLARAGDVDPRAQIELLLGLGRACWATGEADRARDACERAADIANRIGDAAASADAALGFCGPFFEMGATWTRRSVDLLHRALAMLDGRDSALRARLVGRLAAARAYAGGGRSDHRPQAYSALEMARRVGDEHALAEVLAACHWATRGPDDRRHLGMARELTRLAAHVGDARLLAYGHQWEIGHLLARGEIDAATGKLDQLTHLADTRNDRYARWAATVARTMLAFGQGQLELADALALDALGQWGDRRQFTPPGAVFAGQMIMLRREQGRLGELVERVVTQVEQNPLLPVWRCALSHVHAHTGDLPAARRELERVGDLADLPRDGLWLLGLTLVASAACLIGDDDSSRRAYELLVPYADTHLVTLSVLCEGSNSRPLGMLATAVGRYDDAERHFQRALAMNADIRSPLWTAHTQYEHARMLRLRGRAGDRERARTLLAAARAAADELGLPALRERVGAEAPLVDAA